MADIQTPNLQKPVPPRPAAPKPPPSAKPDVKTTIPTKSNKNSILIILILVFFFLSLLCAGGFLGYKFWYIPNKINGYLEDVQPKYSQLQTQRKAYEDSFTQNVVDPESNSAFDPAEIKDKVKQSQAALGQYSQKINSITFDSEKNFSKTESVNKLVNNYQTQTAPILLEFEKLHTFLINFMEIMEAIDEFTQAPDDITKKAVTNAKEESEEAYQKAKNLTLPKASFKQNKEFIVEITKLFNDFYINLEESYENDNQIDNVIENFSLGMKYVELEKKYQDVDLDAPVREYLDNFTELKNLEENIDTEIQSLKQEFNLK